MVQLSFYELDWSLALAVQPLPYILIAMFAFLYACGTGIFSPKAYLVLTRPSRMFNVYVFFLMHLYSPYSILTNLCSYMYPYTAVIHWPWQSTTLWIAKSKYASTLHLF